MAEQIEQRGRKPKELNLTEEQRKAHALNMARYHAAIRANRGFREAIFSTPESLTAKIDEYIALMCQTRQTPTENGFMTFADCEKTWYYATMAQNDERAEILRKYRQYVDEYINQAGLMGASNTIFSIYYLKSKMQQWDAPTEQTINLNIGAQQAISPGDLLQLAQNTPIEAEYTEVDNDAE